MNDLRSIRALPRESLRGIEPASVIDQVMPTFEMVDPCELYVEVSYQREVGENGVAMIRRIYAGFNWRRFKPPICIHHVEANVLVCIDGQHTAIAAASHPGVHKIPVMIVSASEASERADAFVGHNRDRVSLTPMAIYRAELASGDPVAAIMEKACKIAGAVILTNSINLRDRQPVGSTIAVGTIRSLASKHGESLLARVLGILVRAKRGPIKAGEIGAVARILVMGNVDEAKLLAVITAKTPEQWAALAGVRATETNEKLPDAIASVWCRELNVRLGRRASDDRKPAPAPQAASTLAQSRPAPPRPRPTPKPVQAPPLPRPTHFGGVNKMVPAPQPPSPAPTTLIRRVEHNGVAIDLRTMEVTYQGKSTIMETPDAVRLVAALARVMPSILDTAVLAPKVLMKASHDSVERLRWLCGDVNRALNQAGLKVQAVGKVGYNLSPV